MSRPAWIAIAASLALACSAAAEPTHAYRVTIRADTDGWPISPLIYGGNHDLDGFEFDTARRLGGNRLTAYNWETDASNAGKDYHHTSDGWLAHGKPTEWWRASIEIPAHGPARALRAFHDESLARGAFSLVTVPMAGYVAADGDGPVAAEEAAPSDRWARVTPRGGPLGVAGPDLSDGLVHVDQLIEYLVGRYGRADSGRGVNAYSLDNEPGLWHETHPRVVRRPITCHELIARSLETAATIKRGDPSAEVLGPALWGMSGFTHLKDAPDWPRLQADSGSEWFIDAYLDAFRRASEMAGEPLLDALDVHWYAGPATERHGGLEAVVNAPRSLYDATYIEPTWIGKHFARFLPLLPRLQRSIDERNPGVGIAISEYDWLRTDSIHGGLAQVDALGAFGAAGVDLAFYHHRDGSGSAVYVASAFRLYRDYDGAGGAFGDVGLPVERDDMSFGCAYASRDPDRGTIHLILSNRALEDDIVVEARLEGAPRPARAEVWRLEGGSPELKPGRTIEDLDARATRLRVPALSAMHVIFHPRSGATP
jgi:hypothetical protein